MRSLRSAVVPHLHTPPRPQNDRVHRIDVNINVIGGGGIDSSGQSTMPLPLVLYVQGESILPSGEKGNKRKILTMTTTTQWERHWRRWKRKGTVLVVAVNNKEEVALFVVAVDPYS